MTTISTSTTTFATRAFPRPGTDEQLKLLAGRIVSQQLDRGKPLWELWVVEGLDNDRFGIIAKIHHCMIDGVSGIDLTGHPPRRRPEIRGRAARRLDAPARVRPVRS